MIRSEVKLCERGEELGHLPPLPKLEMVGPTKYPKIFLPKENPQDFLNQIESREKAAHKRIADLKRERRKIYQKQYRLRDGFREMRREYKQAWRDQNREHLRACDDEYRVKKRLQRQAYDKVWCIKRRLAELEQKVRELDDTAASVDADKSEDESE